jgi:hypothetical protein
MGDGEAAGGEVSEQRLDVADQRAALRGVAGVADGGEAWQALGQVRAVEIVADEAEMAFGVEALRANYSA